MPDSPPPDALAEARRAAAVAEAPICGKVGGFSGLPCVEPPNHDGGHVFATHDTRVASHHLRTALSLADRLRDERDEARRERDEARNGR